MSEDNSQNASEGKEVTLKPAEGSAPPAPAPPAPSPGAPPAPAPRLPRLLHRLLKRPSHSSLLNRRHNQQEPKLFLSALHQLHLHRLKPQ